MADGYLNFDVKTNTKGFDEGIDKINSKVNNMTSSFKKLGAVVGGAFAIKGLINFANQAINLASDLEEVQNVVDTAFGSMAYKAEEFAKIATEQFGMSKLAAKQFSSVYMGMGRGMGLSMEEASNMAIDATKRIGDVASFYNKSFAEVDTMMKSVWTGETESLKQIGVVMNETNLQAFALSKGINKQLNTLSQAEKTQLRYAYVMEQTKLAAGDFTKTSDGWANQTRVLSERWKEFMSIIGSGLIQVLNPVLKFINMAIAKLIDFANAFATISGQLFGKQTKLSVDSKNIEAAATAQGDLADETERAGKAAKGALAGFDEINTLATSGEENTNAPGVGGVDLGLNTETAIGEDVQISPNLINAIDTLKLKIEEIKQWIDLNIAPSFINAMSLITPQIENFKLILGSIFDNITDLGAPLKTWFDADFTPFLQNTIESWGTITSGLFDSFNMVFSDIWNIVIFPMLEKFITDGLPMWTQFADEITKTGTELFNSIKGIFDMLWQEGVAPALGMIMTIWNDTFDIMVNKWNEYGAPIFENIRQAFKGTADLLKTLWDKTLKPVWDNFMQTVDWLWTKHLKPLLDNFVGFVAEFINCALEIINKFIIPLVKEFVEKFGPPIAEVFNFILNVIGTVIGAASDIISGIITVLKGIIQFITGVFTGDWKKAWEGIVNVFKGIVEMIAGIFKGVFNIVIDVINIAIKLIVSGINMLIQGAIDLINKIPGINLQLAPIPVPQIPKLARGGIVDSPTIAMIGERGKEAVIPLENTAFVDTLASALGNAVMMAMQFNNSNNNSNASGDAILQLDGTTFARLINPYNTKETSRQGNRLIQETI